jgi:hypothetical protein
MSFFISKNQEVSGSSLWFVLSDVTDVDVDRVFGISFPDENDEKYSSTFVIESEATNARYTLYKSYGVWRVGRFNTFFETDGERLDLLLITG